MAIKKNPYYTKIWRPNIQPATEPEHQQHNPTPENPTEDREIEATSQQPTQAEDIENPTPIPEPNPPQPAEPKQPRMLSRLSDGLDGANWKTPNFEIEPTRSRRRYVAAQVIFMDKHYDGPDSGSPENTELVDSEEPETIHDENCIICAPDSPHETDRGEPEEPGRNNPTNQDPPNQKEP